MIMMEVMPGLWMDPADIAGVTTGEGGMVDAIMITRTSGPVYLVEEADDLHGVDPVWIRSMVAGVLCSRLIDHFAATIQMEELQRIIGRSKAMEILRAQGMNVAVPPPVINGSRGPRRSR